MSKEVKFLMLRFLLRLKRKQRGKKLIDNEDDENQEIEIDCSQYKGKIVAKRKGKVSSVGFKQQ